MSTQIQITPETGITIGTTTVTSGTDTRVFFQEGGVVQQDANFTYNNTQKRLTLRAGGATASDIPFVVRNSTDTENILACYGNELTIIGRNASTEPRLIINRAGSTKMVLGGTTDLNIEFPSSGFGELNSGAQGWDIISTSGDIRTRNSSTYTLLKGNFFGIGQATPAARLDVRAQGALSTDIAFRVRNSADTADLVGIQGNSTINLLANNVNNPVLNVRSNINPTLNFTDANGTGAIIAHRYQFNPGQGSNLLSQSINIVSYGVGGGQLGVSKINNIMNTTNWGTATQAQREGGFYVYFRSSNTFESITSTDRAFWVTPDKRTLLYNQTGSVVVGDTDAFSLYSDDITAGNAAPHFRTENGSIIKLFQGAALTASDGTLANAVTRIAELEARLKAHGLIA